MRKSQVIAGVVVVAVMGSGAYFGLRGRGEEAPTYQTTQVRTATVREVVSGTGTLEAKKTYPVLVQKQGVVDRLNVKEGDKVAYGRQLFSVAGSPVFAISGRTPLYRQLKSGDSGRDVAIVQYFLERLGYASTVDAEYGSETIDALHEFQDDKGLEEVDTVGPDAFQALPLPLRVMDVAIEQGQSVSPGTVAMTFANPRLLEVVIDVNEIDMPKVKLGQRVAIEVDALPGKRFTGKVLAVSQGLISSTSSQTQSDAQSGSTSSETGVVNYPVTIALASGDSRLKAGMQASADIVTKVRKNVLSVPSGALHERDGGKYVMVLARRRAQRVPVEVGLNSDTRVEIRSGLEDGQRVIIGPATSSSVTSSARSPGMGMFGGGRRD